MFCIPVLDWAGKYLCSGRFDSIGNQLTADSCTKKQKERRESQEGKCRREYGEYTHIAKTGVVKVADGNVTFCQNFKYLGTWVSYSLCDEYDITE